MCENYALELAVVTARGSQFQTNDNDVRYGLLPTGNGRFREVESR